MKIFTVFAIFWFLADLICSDPQFYPNQYGYSQVYSGYYPQPNQYNSQSPPSTNNSNGQSNANINSTDYAILSDFLQAYGLNLGSSENPTVSTVSTPSANDTMNRIGLLNNLANNPIQQYMNQNAQLLNQMLRNPNTVYNVNSLFQSPVSNAFGILGTAAKVTPNYGIQSRSGLSMSAMAQQQGFSFTINGLVDFVVGFLYNNPSLYNGILGLLIQFLKLIPSLLDTVFRIIASVNNLFNPSLIQLLLSFIYNYQIHSPENFFKLTTLLITFLNKDYNISTQALRDIIALVGKFPI